jgi:hypothetical protein
MNKIDFTQTGGYRLKQTTFKKMQDAYFEAAKALVHYFGFAEVGNFIISGCEINGANITSGYMYIDGDICPFVGAIGNLTTKIKKSVTSESLSFKNGSTYTVFTNYEAIIDPLGTALEDFVRAIKPIDNSVNFLAKGSVALGSIGNVGVVEIITFDTPIATADYMVIGEFTSIFVTGESVDASSVSWEVRDKTTTGFKLRAQRTPNASNNYTFKYKIIEF